MIEGALLAWWQQAWSWLDLPFMVRAMGATTVLCLGLAPVGAFLVLRRLSLAGEAIAHAVVPGIAIAFVIAGLGVWSMLVGGLIAGLLVALASSLLARVSLVREDASLAALYLILAENADRGQANLRFQSAYWWWENVEGTEEAARAQPEIAIRAAAAIEDAREAGDEHTETRIRQWFAQRGWKVPG